VSIVIWSPVKDRLPFWMVPPYLPLRSPVVPKKGTSDVFPPPMIGVFRRLVIFSLA